MHATLTLTHTNTPNHTLTQVHDNTGSRHAHQVFGFAKAMVAEAHQVLMPHNNQPVVLRVGIHSGPIVSGVVGSRMPKFCL